MTWCQKFTVEQWPATTLCWVFHQRDYKWIRSWRWKKLKQFVRQREAVCEQQLTIKGDRLEAPQLLEAVGQKNQKGTKKQTRTPPQKQCTQCGKDQHPRNSCPAKEATCRKCQKKGHFTVIYRSKILHNVEQDNPTLDHFYLDTSWHRRLNLLDYRCQS